jgi:alkaline phosphatase D
MTGPAQEQWLLNRLDRSTATSTVIAQQTMFAQFDFLVGPGQLFNMDQWDGYVAARQRITAFLQERQPSNPIVITGDIHSSWVHTLKADFADPASAAIGTEFVGTSISSEFPVIAVGPVFAALADNPHTQFFDGLFRGYVRCTVTPDTWLTDFRVVPTILHEGAEAFTLASFAVLNGQPGAIPA